MSSPSIARAARAALVALCLTAAAASTAAASGPDALAPAVTGPSATMERGAERPTLELSLSEDATVVVGLRRVMTSARASGAMPVLRFKGGAGLNRFTLRAPGLRAGRYTLRIIAVDAAGNESPSSRTTLRIAGH